MPLVKASTCEFPFFGGHTSNEMKTKDIVDTFPRTLKVLEGRSYGLVG